MLLPCLISTKYCDIIKMATPYKARMTALYVICFHIFRHLTQKFLDIRLKEVPLGYVSMPAKFLCNLTKNLTAHLTHNLCAVLPYKNL